MGQVCDVGEAEVAHQYFQRRAELNLDCSPSAPLIIDLRGREVTAEQLEKYLIRARTVRVALQANGSFCAAVLEARKGKKLSQPFKSGSCKKEGVKREEKTEFFVGVGSPQPIYGWGNPAPTVFCFTSHKCR